MLHRTLQIVTGTLSGLAVVAVLLSTGVLGPGRTESFSVSAPGLQPYPAPPLGLPQADGTPFDLTELKGGVALVFFGFSNCPDVCPLTLSTWSRALARIGDDGERFHAIFVSVDPGRDSPEALGRWMESFDPSIRALTGTEADVARVTADWGVYVGIREDERRAGGAASDTANPHAEHTAGSQDSPVGSAPGTGAQPMEGAGPAYLVDHSARTFVVDREGRIVQVLPPDLDPEALVAALDPLLRP